MRRTLLKIDQRALFFLCMLALVGVFASAKGWAQDGRRFPHSQITAEQWQIFFDEVRAKPGVRDLSRPDRPDVTVLAVEAEHTIYYFTKPGPAHPAVVIARVIERDHKVFVEHEGYFAGSEAAFARWFELFKNQTGTR